MGETEMEEAKEEERSRDGHGRPFFFTLSLVPLPPEVFRLHVSFRPAKRDANVMPLTLMVSLLLFWCGSLIPDISPPAKLWWAG